MQGTESSWLRDGVKEIERLTRAAQIVKPEIFALPGERDGVYAIVQPGPAGQPITIQRHVAEPDWHRHYWPTPTN